MIPNRFKRGTVLKRLSCCLCLTMCHVITLQDQNLLDKLSTGDLIATRGHVPMSKCPCSTQSGKHLNDLMNEKTAPH